MNVVKVILIAMISVCVLAVYFSLETSLSVGDKFVSTAHFELTDDINGEPMCDMFDGQTGDVVDKVSRKLGASGDVFWFYKLQRDGDWCYGYAPIGAPIKKIK